MVTEHQGPHNIELRTADDDTLADTMSKVSQVRGLAELVGEARSQVEGRLREQVDAMTAATGTHFTAKRDGWSAYVTDPQPKPRVSDREAFAEWADANPDARVVVGRAERVEVTDHALAAQALDWAGSKVTDHAHAASTADASRDELAACVEQLYATTRVVVEIILPDDPFERMLKRKDGRFVATDDGLVDRNSGELVPGVVCERAREQLTVKGTPEAKAAAKRDVAERLGLAPTIEEGNRDD